jgi:predicted nucleotidyltransferase component of viral defense system
MFQISTIDEHANEVLRRLFSIHYIKKNFALAGGTALALQLGHRRSVDLDVFSTKPFVIPKLQDTLRKNFKELYIPVNTGRLMFFASLDNVKTDFVMELTPVLKDFTGEDGLKLFSVPDIAAMKLHTIAGRGKKKDFFDIYALLHIYSWDELLDFFVKKYNQQQLPFLFRSIHYFEDADNDPDVSAFHPYKAKWSEIKKYIKSKTK